MHRFKCHGTYIHDRGDALRLCPIEEETAWELLAGSKYVEREEHVTQDGALLNKGYAVVQVRGDQAILVYNHDGTYYLHTAPAASTLASLKLK